MQYKASVTVPDSSGPERYEPYMYLTVSLIVHGHLVLVAGDVQHSFLTLVIC